VVDALVRAFNSAIAEPFGTDWNSRQKNACQCLAGTLSDTVIVRDVFLGGDRLRPYLTVQCDDRVWIVAQQTNLVPPRIAAAFEAGTWQAREERTGNPAVMSAPTTPTLRSSLAVPKLYLTTLTNTERYQTRRYPLNVSRLAQWARFHHIAKVCVSDLALSFNGSINDLCADIVKSEPDVIGVSVNFGELLTLELVVKTLLRTCDSKPILCLGNVLAAWEPSAVRTICREFEHYISPSYGEPVIEQACRRALDRVNGGTSITSLPIVRTGGATHPTAIVYPDERLLQETLIHGGQASIETSFGCQYSQCTFCPRDHRTRGWRRPAINDAVAVVHAMAADMSSRANGAVVSIVDEDAFGSEGINPHGPEPSIIQVINAGGVDKVSFEIYTRAEQLFNRSWRRSDSVRCLRQLASLRPRLTRVFIGVESGCDTQLARYKKGQSVQDIVYALRAGSLLDLPMEFGFITFDPLITLGELTENILFLCRTDVLLTPVVDKPADEILDLVRANDITGADPLFTRVAYMATELEVFAGSTMAARLKAHFPELVRDYDASFARFRCDYNDSHIGRIASWCRVWTEGTFAAVYRMRLSSRTNPALRHIFRAAIRSYREATFALLVTQARDAGALNEEQWRKCTGTIDSRLLSCLSEEQLSDIQLRELWACVREASGGVDAGDAEFSLAHLGKRRDA